MHRRHTTGGGKPIFGTLQSGDPLLKHPHSGIAISGINKFIRPGLLKPRLRRLGRGIGKALCHINCFRHFRKLRAPGAGMHRECTFIACHLTLLKGTKKPTGERRGLCHIPNPFSSLFNVARNPVTNRHVSQIMTQPKRVNTQNRPFAPCAQSDSPNTCPKRQ